MAPQPARTLEDAIRRSARAFCGCGTCALEARLDPSGSCVTVLRCSRALGVADALETVRESLPWPAVIEV